MADGTVQELSTIFGSAKNEGPSLAFVSGEVDDETLRGVPDGSIVAMTGMCKPREVRSFAKALGSRHPHLYMTDCHVVPSQDLAHFDVGPPQAHP